MDSSWIIENKNRVVSRIAKACAAAQRAEDSVQLVWVSKTRSVADVDLAFAVGARIFGENRVQEAEEKFSTVRAGVRCHLIGPIQSNKLRKAVAVAHCIESVSSLDQVKRLEILCAQANKIIYVYFQVNTSLEDTKSGLSMQECLDFLKALPPCPHLVFRGLMTIGKNTGNPEDSRAGFAWLRGIRDQFVNTAPHFAQFSELSMGMTDDLEVAISEGSTQVRVGTALFGRR